MRLRDRRRKNRGVYRAEARVMAEIKRLEGWPRRHPWRALARARAREPYVLRFGNYTAFTFGGEPARHGSFNV
jgi:hypothetical protein